MLQPLVPFELDLHDGSAWVSLVAFDLRNMRPGFGGLLSRFLFAPLGNQRFLNVRTYVRHGDVPGIYFLSEWLNSRLNVALGPKLYDLPFRFGKLDYRHATDSDFLSGTVREGARQLTYTGACAFERPFQAALPDSHDEFLLERYTAFTARNDRRGWFPVWHPRWNFRQVDIQKIELDLLWQTGDWINHAELASAHFSPGFEDVWMGWRKPVI